MPYRVKTAFAVGPARSYAEGDLIADDDPVLKGREALVEEVGVAIERATAAPGEKRTTPRKKAPAKKSAAKK